MKWFNKSWSLTTGIATVTKLIVILGPEARGFIFGVPVAYALGVGFIPVRKKGKLPFETVSVSYDLEYGTDVLEIHKDAIKKGQRVAIVDDLLATGGTIEAVTRLVEAAGGEVVALDFAIELTELKGRDKLKGYEFNRYVILELYRKNFDTLDDLHKGYINMNKIISSY